MLEPGEGRIELRGASFGYGGQAVVEGVDLSIGPGDFVGVLGPNGSGKTTLFRGILGLLPASSGSVSRTLVRPGYVPQRDTLDPVFPLTVFEVVAMGSVGSLDWLGRLRPEHKQRVDELLAEVGLVEQRRSLFSALSGGQRQRALLARALLPRPNVLLLDEPTSGVDAPTQERILELLQRLNQERGLAILLVSHHIASTLEAVRRVVWVDRGKAVSVDGADELDLSRIDDLFAGASARGEVAAERRR